MKILFSLVAFFLLIQQAAAQGVPKPIFVLASDDIVQCQLFLYKHAGAPLTGFLRIGYSPGKNAEFTTIAAINPQKKFPLVINGKPFGEVDAPILKKPSNFDLNITSPDDAFALAKTFVVSPTKPAAVLTQNAEAPIFSLVPADVFKTVITLSKDKTELETSFVKPRQIEFAATAASNLQKQGEIVLNGQTVGELTITKPTLGHSVSVEMPAADAAFAMAKALMEQVPNSPPKTP